FYPLFEGHSLFHRTITRNVDHSTEFIIVVNQEQFFMAEDQFQALKTNIPVQFVLEPEGRNTAPAIALAALAAQPSDALLIVPSDHLVCDVAAYKTGLQTALK